VHACSNKAGELSQAASHLRRLLGVCSAVFPKNFPELGNMQQALGEVLTHMIAARGAALPKKTAAAMRSECRDAFRKAMEVRRVAFGDTHALTQESRRAWEAAGGRA
jgi:acyl-CoA reductase-like NAD-dependent aldehyde dehydrogenase